MNGSPDLKAATDKFFTWLDKMQAEARKTPVGQRMFAEGWSVQHTGGGCLAWQKDLPGGFYFWICDASNGLGDKLDEEYLAGLYEPQCHEPSNQNVSDDFIDNDEALIDLDHALAWCKAREADPASHFKAAHDEILRKAGVIKS